jgi:alkylation response protein AidB-like acyl-CoA dehydrogenase
MHLTDSTDLDSVRDAASSLADDFGRAYYLDRLRSGGGTRDMWSAIADRGLLALGVPVEHGGIGEGITPSVAALEAMCYAGAIPPDVFIVSVFMRAALVAHGSPEQNSAWLPELISGKIQYAFAMTEREAGTNSFALKTRAVRDSDGSYLITGEKIFITGIDEADRVIVVARLATTQGDRLTLFAVDLPADGLTFDRLAMTTHGPDSHFAVHFQDVRVPAGARIGSEGGAKEVLFSALNPERYVAAAAHIGLGRRAVRVGADYARTRSPFGAPIGSYQAIQHSLARAHINLEAARLMMYHGAEKYDAGEATDQVNGAGANMTKYLATVSANEALDAALQLHGGAAFLDDTDLVALWPRIRMGRMVPINNEMVLNYVSERLLDLPKSY